MMSKKWLLLGLALVTALVLVGLLVYNFMPQPLLSEEFQKMCGERNECLWM